MTKLTVKKEFDKSSLSAFITDYFKERQPATYDEYDKLQTIDGRRRSFGDIVALCNSYFECTEKEIAEILIKLWEDYIIGCLFCPGITKVVFYLRDTEKENDWYITPVHFQNNPNGADRSAGYNKPTTIGEDGYTFTDIYNLAKQ